MAKNEHSLPSAPPNDTTRPGQRSASVDSVSIVDARCRVLFDTRPGPRHVLELSGCFSTLSTFGG